MWLSSYMCDYRIIELIDASFFHHSDHGSAISCLLQTSLHPYHLWMNSITKQWPPITTINKKNSKGSIDPQRVK